MSKSIAEQTAEALGKVEARPAAQQPATDTRPYDPVVADALRDATMELHGGEAEWVVNFKSIENGGLNAKGEPGVLAAIKTAKFSLEHPKNMTAYNGNRGPSVTFAGFSPGEVDAIFEAATA